ANLCVVDTFLITSAAPSAGWKRRSLDRALQLFGEGQIGEFALYVRSLLWRALFRLIGNQLPSLLHKPSSFGKLLKILTVDPVFEEELTMRLFIRKAAPWIASLDRAPAPLRSPAILLRTMRLNACDVAAWQRRCPGIQVIKIPGDHQSLFDPEHVGLFREAFCTATHDWR